MKDRRTVRRPCCHQRNSGKTGAFKSHDIGAELLYVFLFQCKPDSAMRRNTQRSPPMAGMLPSAFCPTHTAPQGPGHRAGVVRHFESSNSPHSEGLKPMDLDLTATKTPGRPTSHPIKSKDLLCSCEERKREGDASWGAENPLIYHYFINQPPHSPR